MFELLPKPIVEHIYKVTEQELSNPKNTVRCTELLYCLRKAWLRRKFGVKLTEEQRWFIYRGNVFDVLWTRLFDDKQVEVKLWVDDELAIVGHADFIYEDAVWELKTIATIKALWDKNEQKYKPKPWHVKQALFYAHCLGLKKVRLCYISFDGIMVFTEDDFDITTDSVLSELKDRAQTLYACLKEDIPPPKTDQSWECKYCEVKEFCDNAQKERI